MNADDLLSMVEKRMRQAIDLRLSTIAGVKTLIKRYMRTHPQIEIGDTINLYDYLGAKTQSFIVKKLEPSDSLRCRGTIWMESQDDPTKKFSLIIFSPKEAEGNA